MKTTKKKNEQTKKVNMERTREIAEVIGSLSNFIPRIDGSSSIPPLFSREFLLKNLLGLTNEEYEENNRLLEIESVNIINALKELTANNNVVEANNSKKNKKEKVN